MNRRRLRHLPLKSMPGQGFLGVLGCCRVSLNLKRNERPRSQIEEDNGKGGTRTLDPGIMRLRGAAKHESPSLRT